MLADAERCEVVVELREMVEGRTEDGKAKAERTCLG